MDQMNQIAVSRGENRIGVKAFYAHILVLPSCLVAALCNKMTPKTLLGCLKKEIEVGRQQPILEGKRLVHTYAF